MSSARATDAERLVAAQAETWPLLAQGLAGLRAARTRALRVASSEVLVRHIPHRMRSTTAAVDAASVAKRPCFLCAANLPPEEVGLPLDAGFTAYANPFPIVESHLTIVHRDHRPQAIDGHLEAALLLAGALRGFFLVYNGPACGASAPDHLHFQAGAKDGLPIAADAARAAGPAIPDAGRRAFVLRGAEAGRVAARARRLLGFLAEATGRGPEPLVNLVLWREEGGFTLLVFPRAKHRPRVFETGELTVSPAAIDLAGVFVVPRAEDFQRIGAEEVAAVYAEVTLGERPFAQVLRRLAEEP